MVHISVKQGLNIPIGGKPQGAIQSLVQPAAVVFNLEPYQHLRFQLLVKEGDLVHPGQPLLVDKSDPLRFGVAPVSGVVREIIRGDKRRLLGIKIECQAVETVHTPRSAQNKEEVIKAISDSGLFFHIRVRPFNRLAKSTETPRSIFVKAVDTAPFAVPPEFQTIGYEECFQLGLQAFNILTPGSVHLVYSANNQPAIFSKAQNVQKHTVEGPHPSGNSSIHIAHIDPITSPHDVIWTVTVWDVVALGHFLKFGVPLCQRVISLAGEGLKPTERAYVKTLIGTSVAELTSNRLEKGDIRTIVGDPLMGRIASKDDSIGLEDSIISAIPEAGNERLMLHFLRLGKERYTATKTYLSAYGPQEGKKYYFTTSQHGEERAFIDASIYEQVMPLRVLPMQIAKACLADDYERAVEYGLLEVAPEDFALCEFICPSKVEMVDIVRDGIEAYSKEILV